mmetsp:Transcript_41041/g.131254  ORF Transcript_41041/g.131254 Transcript_41041/m.131254 type:complete len:287 (-) Transcript_41041:1796-2656(-)
MKLVDIGLKALEDEDSTSSYEDMVEALPGVGNAWLIEKQNQPELIQGMVGEAARRLAQLRRILGGDGVDVVWMVLREPPLLTASPAAVARRLVQMSVDMAGQGVSIVELVEDQPGLLLQDHASLAATGETAAARLEAWRFGLASAGEGEWADLLAELAGYRERHGDCSVGCRRGDAPELARWARLARKQRKDGTLSADKVAALEENGFLWAEEEAEWEFMYSELLTYFARNGDVDIKPWGSDENSNLRHWASIQRVSKRNKVLSADRLERLLFLDFNFSGVDGIHA